MRHPDPGRELHAELPTRETDRALDPLAPREPFGHVARAAERGTTARRAVAAALLGLAALLAVPAGAEAQSENAPIPEIDPPVPAAGDLRLVNGQTDYDGRLEIFLNDRWGSICYYGFDKVDAEVACRNLGMGRSTEIDIPWNSKGSHPVMNNPRCTGTEERLADCPRDNDEPPWCYIQIVADITCNGHAATGAPTITGEPKVGQRLTADLSGIVDEDGLSDPRFTYRWLADDRELPGVRDVAYQVTEAVEGKRIKVRVGFTDDQGGRESLTSVATGAVPLLPKVLVQPTSLEVDEGASASYTVALRTEPTGEVTVAVGGTSGTDVTVSSTSVTFTAATWNVAQTVTVSAAHDTDRVDDPVTLTHAASNADYDDVPVAEVAVAVLDDETTAPGAPAGLTATVSQRAFAISLGWTAPADNGGSAVTGYRVEVSEEEDETSWTVAAEIDSSMTGYTHGGLGAETTYHYRVTAANRVGRSVPSASVSGTTLSGPVDGVLRLRDGGTDHEGRLEIFLSGQWGGICYFDFGQVDADMACRDLGYGRSTRRFIPDRYGSGPVMEDPRCTGSEASFGDCPRTRPATCWNQNVVGVACNGHFARGAPTVTGRPQAGYELTADPSGIVDDDGLSTPNFNYVWLADDRVIPGAVSATLTLSDTEVGKRIAVRVRFTDDQGGTETLTSAAGEAVMPRPAIVVEAPAPFTVNEGASAVWTVALRTEPTGEVTVAVGGTSGTDVTVSPESLTFTTASWSVAQTVTVSAGHDEDRVADAATLTHAASGADYGGVAPGVDLAVTVLDDETVVPGAPAGLTAAAVGNGHRVVLAWTAPADSGGSAVAGYRIEVSEGSEGTEAGWTVAADTASLDTGYTVGRLKAGTAYRFRVSAANRVGPGEPSATASATTGASLVCGRTPEVRDAIVGAAAFGGNPSSPDCREVTAEHLAAIAGLRIRNETGLSTLRAGDFAGMAGLARLEISTTALSGLPAGIFSGLPELRTLDLGRNALASLSADGFAGLGALNSLDLGGNDLASLPAGVFAGLGALTSLDLDDNDLASLSAGAFAGLGALDSLDLAGNDLTGLPDGFFTALAGVTSLDLRHNAAAPVPVPVRPEKVGDDRIKVVVPAGAPFDLVLPIAVSGGATVVGGAESLSIAAGAVESETVEISPRPVDETAAVAVTLGTVPSPPRGHRGYRLALDERLELVAAVEWTVTVSASALAEADADAATLTVSTDGFTFTEDRTLDLGMGGTATGAGDDYTVADGDGTVLSPPYALSLPTGATSVTATITAVDDTVRELRETIEITVRDDGEAIGAQPTVSIADDDPTGDPEISVVAGNSPLREDRDSHAIFTLSRKTGLDEALTVNVTVTQEGDFVAAAGLGAKSVAFAEGAERATLHVAIDDDDVGEFDGGTIIAAIAAGDGYGAHGPRGSASVRVLDDELRLAVYLETPETVVKEYNPPGDDSLWNSPRFKIRVETPPGGLPVPVGTNQLAYYDSTTDPVLASHKVASNGYTFIGDLFPVSAIGYLSITFDNEHYHRRADGAMVATRTLEGPPILNDWLLDDNEVFLVSIESVPGSGIWFPESESGSETGPVSVRVRIRDSHRPSWRLSVTPDRISEDGTEPTQVKVRVTRPFERSQRVTLELSGTAVEGVDYTIEDKTLTLPGGRYSVSTTLTPVDNPDGGEDKTVIVTARHEKKRIGTVTLYEGGPLGLEETLTIADDDLGVSITADASPVSEGTAAAFTLARTGDATEALTVAVAVTETGAVLDGAAPTVAVPEELEPDAVLDGVVAPPETEADVVFLAGSATASLTIATADDEVAEDASVVTVAIAAGDGYEVAGARPSAEVTVEDDDAAPVVATAAALEAPENGTAVATLEATDEDTPAAALTWSITGGADADKLAVTDAGALTFGAAKDYEAPDDADGDGVYEVTVEVSDGANAVAASLTVTLADLDEIAPTLSEATVDGATLTLLFDEPLDEGEMPAIDDFTVTVADATRHVDQVAVEGSSVVLTLASAVTADEVVTVGYTVPALATDPRIRDVAGNAAAGFTGQAVTNVTVPGNYAPTGRPEISGTAREGEVLTASVAGIADADGTDDATFSYRWLADDGVTVAEIAEATGTTFELTAAQAGKTIRVRVTFTDDRGTEETLTSAPTENVTALPIASLRAAAAFAKEGDAALFTLTRTGDDVSSALTVAVTIEASGAVLATPVPAGATFASGVAEVELAVATVDDGAAGGDGTVTAQVVAGAGYRLAAGNAATGSVTVLDDDPAPVAVVETGEVVWSADLSVVDYGTGAIGAGTAGRFSNEAGSAGLSARWLWYGTQTRELRLAFTSGVDDAEDMVLKVSGLELAFPAKSGGNSSFLWFDVDLSWTDGETVAARVVKPGSGGAATDATLSALTVTDAELTPAFDPQVLVYAAAVDADTETVTVTAATNDDDASVSYGPSADADAGEADHQASTPVGETLFAVTVTAADGETRRVYRVVATRLRPAVTVSFGASSYGAMEGGDVASVAVTMSGDPGRTVTIPLSATPGGGAVAADYAVPAGVRFAAGGSLTQTVSVAAIADEEAETGEHVVLGFGALPRGLVAGATGTATVSLADLSNRAPAGRPAISGTPRVGEVLTASAGAISDADGIENATFVWQWLAANGTVETAIAGATGESHELTVAEAGRTVRVRVTFTDDRGTEETLASVATEVVAATVPSAPVGLAAATGEGREGELAVSWTAPESDGGSEVTGYRVQWKSGTEAWDGSQTSTRQAVLSDPAATSHTIGGLANGTAYTVRVMAVNAVGAGAAAEVEATVRDRAVPTLASAAVDGAVLTLTYSEALDGNSAPAAGAFTVTVADMARTVDAVAVSQSALALTLASAVVAGETVTVDYAVPADAGAARIEDEAGNAAAAFTGEAVTNVTAAPTALGAPEISGTARVGEVLTVSLDGVADDLNQATFAYQWLAAKGTVESEIAGATAATYSLAAAEAGKTVRVRVQVRFTYPGGAEHTVVSAPTEVVAATVPSAPVGLAAATGEGREGELAVSWAAPESDGGSEVTGYRVQWKSGTEAWDGSETSTRQALLSDPAATSHTIGGLANGTAYTVRVVAVNAAGDGAAAVVEATVRDRVAPTLASAAVDGAALTLTYSEALDGTSAPAAGAFTVTVAGAGCTVDDVAISQSTVALTLASAVVADETVTVGYAVPDDAGTARIEDEAGNAAAGFTGEAVINETEPPNAAPAGLPVITGTPRVGEKLSAWANAIADADGIENATFAWQWLANDGTDDAEIEDATRASFTLTVAEVGRTVRVRVTFTDDRGTEETLVSIATEAVAATVPSAPVGLAAATGEGREGELAVSWTAPESDGGSEVTGYRVQWKSGTEAWDGSQTSTRQALLSDPAATSHTIGGLANGTAYTVRVVAVNAAGDGAAAVVEATVRDRVAPTLASAAVDGAALTLTYSEALDGTSAPAAGAFTVTVAGAGRTVDDVAISQSTVVLTLASAVVADETVTVGYAVPDDAGAARIEDAAGNAAAAFTARTVVNATVPPPPLTVTLSVTDAAAQPGQFEVRVLFSERVTGFLVWELEAERVGGDAATVSEFTGSETLTEWTATVAAPEAGRYRVQLAAGVAQAGTRQSPAAALVVDVDAAGNAAAVVAPVVTRVVQAVAADGTLTDGDRVLLVLKFSEPVTVVTDGGTPSVGITLDGAERPAAYANGMGNGSLLFSYTLTADDGTVSAVSVTANSLALNGGTIRSAAGLDANLAHPGDGDASAPEPEEAAVQEAESDPVAASEVVVDPDALTASFTVVPAAHGGPGSGAFVLELAFSEEPELSYSVLRNASLAATGGSLGFVRRLNPPSSVGWKIKVRPTGWDDVTVTLAGGRACGTSGAVCTEDDKVLSNTTVAVVPGPLALSVADAQVQEAANAVLAFEVTLNRAATGTVTVAYATADGTATAGADYTAASGTLTFEPGEMEKTVDVAVLNDAHDDGGETLTLTLSDPTGARIRDAEATGTIENSDPIPKAWLARFGRTVAGHVVDAVAERLEGSAGGGSQVTLGGQRVALDGALNGPSPGGGTAGGGDAREGARAADTLAAFVERVSDDGAGTGRGRVNWREGGGEDAANRPASRTLGGRDLLLGSSFLLTAGDEGTGTGTAWAAWGRAAVSGFDGDADGLTVDGDVTTFTLGADAARGRWLGGVALAHSTGEGGFRDHADTQDHAGQGSGTLKSTLASVHPYVRFRASERLTLWGVLGHGTGDLTLELDTAGTKPRKTDTEMRMAAAGARGVLVSAADTDGFELAARGDARFERMRSDAVSGANGAGSLAASEAQTSRLRFMLEGSHRIALEGGQTLTPTLEVGLRRDGGDAETGTGIEVGGGLRLSDPARGLTVTAKTRGLLAHEDTAYREWGASGSVKLDPGAGGRGLALSLTPAWGADSGGAERLWSARDARGLAANDAFEPAGRLAAEAGYGFGAFRGRGLATPFAGLSLSGAGDRTWRTGGRWTLGPGIRFSVEGTRSEPANDSAAEHGVAFRATLRW